MEIAVADERALFLQETLTLDQAEGRAWTRKLEAFGALAKMGGLLQRPKDADFELLYKERRYQPFWRVVAAARYTYQRQRDFRLPVSGPEVQNVTIAAVQYPAAAGHVTLAGLEHCHEEYHQELFVEGVSGEKQPALAAYLNYPAVEIPRDNLPSFSAEGGIVVPPQARSSVIVREALAGMIKSVAADRMLEEHVAVERVDLYYRPVFAFQYRWLSRDKEAIMELDGLTGDLRPGGSIFRQYVGKLLDAGFLFDLGVDTVDLLVPGGGIALKIARKGISAARNRPGAS